MVFFKMGNIYVRSDQVLKAIPVLENALELLPDNVEARRLLAQCFKRLEKYDKAIAQYRFLLAVFKKSKDPGNWVATLRKLAAVYLESNNPQDAQRIWAQIERFEGKQKVNGAKRSSAESLTAVREMQAGDLDPRESVSPKTVVSKDEQNMQRDSIIPLVKRSDKPWDGSLSIDSMLDQIRSEVREKNYSQALSLVRKAVMLTPDNGLVIGFAKKIGREAGQP